MNKFFPLEMKNFKQVFLIFIMLLTVFHFRSTPVYAQSGCPPKWDEGAQRCYTQAPVGYQFPFSFYCTTVPGFSQAEDVTLCGKEPDPNDRTKIASCPEGFVKEANGKCTDIRGRTNCQPYRGTDNKCYLPGDVFGRCTGLQLPILGNSFGLTELDPSACPEITPSTTQTQPSSEQQPAPAVPGAQQPAQQAKCFITGEDYGLYGHRVYLTALNLMKETQYSIRVLYPIEADNNPREFYKVYSDENGVLAIKDSLSSVDRGRENAGLTITFYVFNTQNKQECAVGYTVPGAQQPVQLSLDQQINEYCDGVKKCTTFMTECSKEIANIEVCKSNYIKSLTPAPQGSNCSDGKNLNDCNKLGCSWYQVCNKCDKGGTSAEVVCPAAKIDKQIEEACEGVKRCTDFMNACVLELSSFDACLNNYAKSLQSPVKQPSIEEQIAKACEGVEKCTTFMTECTKELPSFDACLNNYAKSIGQPAAPAADQKPPAPAVGADSRTSVSSTTEEGPGCEPGTTNSVWGIWEKGEDGKFSKLVVVKQRYSNDLRCGYQLSQAQQDEIKAGERGREEARKEAEKPKVTAIKINGNDISLQSPKLKINLLDLCKQRDPNCSVPGEMTVDLEIFYSNGERKLISLILKPATNTFCGNCGGKNQPCCDPKYLCVLAGDPKGGSKCQDKLFCSTGLNPTCVDRSGSSAEGPNGQKAVCCEDRNADYCINNPLNVPDWVPLILKDQCGDQGINVTGSSSTTRSGSGSGSGRCEKDLSIKCGLKGEDCCDPANLCEPGGSGGKGSKCKDGLFCKDRKCQ